MVMTRRDLLLSATGGAGALLAAPLRVRALAPEPDPAPVLVLHAGHGPGPAFAAALRRSGAPHREAVVDGLDRRSLAALRAVFERHHGHCLLGMLDDHVYPVFEELARDAGAPVLCRGQHVGGAGGTRHLFHTVPCSRGVGAALAGAVSASTEALQVREVALGAGAAALAAPERRAGPGDWAGAIATLYQAIAAGRYPPRAPCAVARPGHGARAHFSARSCLVRI